MSTVLTSAAQPAAVRHSRLATRARSLVSVADLEPSEISDIVEHATALKTHRPPSLPAPLAARHIALIFDKPSLRTRVSFEVGIARLGGTTTCMAGAEVGLGTRESVADVARTLAQYVDAIVVRTLSHAAVQELAGAAGVPVVNALTDLEHPCQALADLQTLKENLGTLHGRRLAFVGDGNNVCHSLLLAGAAVGLDVAVATPIGFEPEAQVVDRALEVARWSGAHVELTHDPRAAVAGADAVYTDVWASMGDEHEAEERRRAFRGFCITSELMDGAASRAIVMHCLPAHRGEEIAADVIDGPRSVVFEQAQNRMFAQQAVLIHLLRDSGRAATTGEAWAHPLPGSVGALSAP